MDGFTYGFKLEFDDDASFWTDKNMPPPDNHNSALRNSDIVSAKLQKELDAERLLGPFDTPPFEEYMVSPLATTPKKTPGEYRVIHNLSYPEGSSVNDGIDIDKGHVQYQSLDDAIDSLARLGPQTVLSKFDIEHAYKVVPIHPSDVPKVGMFWGGGEILL